MKSFITYGSIEQFRTIIKNVKHAAQYIGVDEDNNILMNRMAKMPIVTATATEKIHGTNAAFCYSNPTGFWVQSRKNIITPENDNADCASNIYIGSIKENRVATKDAWMEIVQTLAIEYDINLDKNIISVYFEWSGGNIQKLSAMTGLDKRVIIFQYFKVSSIKTENNSNEEGKNSDDEKEYWLETCTTGAANKKIWIYNDKHNIFNIMNYKTWEFKIDFNKPLMSQNDFIKLVEEEIEPNSPIGREMGIDGNIGEGVVITFDFNGIIYRFKVKGKEHSKSKVKTLKPVDNIKEQAKIDFATYSCSSSRLEQAWQNTFGIGNEKMKPTINETGTFLRFVIADVMKEELDIMTDIGLTPKDVNGKIAEISRMWFLYCLG